MIISFTNKGLEEISENGSTKHIGSRYLNKCRTILTMLAEAETLEDLNVPQFRLHSLTTKPVRWSMHVNKNYRITFEWEDGAEKVDFEDYH